MPPLTMSRYKIRLETTLTDIIKISNEMADKNEVASTHAPLKNWLMALYWTTSIESYFYNHQYISNRPYLMNHSVTNPWSQITGHPPTVTPTIPKRASREVTQLSSLGAYLIMFRIYAITGSLTVMSRLGNARYWLAASSHCFYFSERAVSGPSPRLVLWALCRRT